MKNLFVFFLILIIFCNIECISQTKRSISLPVVLDEIKKIETASYSSTNFFCYTGDTIPFDEKNYEFFKEYSAPMDTSVGAYFVKFNLADTTKMTFAYDGNIRARIHWDTYHFETDDFSKNKWPYRTVLAPFFAKSKALIEYVFSTNDSIEIDSIETNDYVSYKVSIINERVELVGRLPIHINELGSNMGVISEYILWINRNTKLPYKFQRTLPANTIIEEIYNLNTNKFSKDNFSAAHYIPSDMLPLPNEELSNDLLNTIAFNFRLSDLDGKLHSLNEIDSKVYMINLTSLHCGACITSVSYLEELNQKFDKKDFSFAALYNEKEKVGLLKTASQKELKYNILLVDKKTSDSFKTSLVPAFLILDKDKRIRKIIYGFNKGNTDTEIEKTIKELLLL